MATKNYTVLVLLMLFAVPAYADYNIGFTANTSSTDTDSCTGQCDFALQEDKTPVAILLSAYYTRLPIDVGVEFHATNEPGAALMLRRSFGNHSLAAGAGSLQTELTFKRGNDNATTGNGRMESSDTGRFYAVTYRYQFADGSLVASYAALSDRLDFDGRVVTGFQPSGAPILADTSAQMDVDTRYIRIGYEMRF